MKKNMRCFYALEEKNILQLPFEKEDVLIP